MNASAIALQEMYFSNEFLQLHENLPSLLMLSFLPASPRSQKPVDPKILKINTTMAFSEDKIGIGIIVRNHLGILLLAKFIPRPDSFSVDYGEFQVIIEDSLFFDFLQT